jgi:hypothetical protein
MTSKFPQLIFDEQIDAAVMSLKRHQINDPDYWFDTVDIVSEGYDPKAKKRIDLDGLHAWLERCKQKPHDQEEEDAQDAPKSNTRSIHPQNRAFPDD